MAKHNEPVTGPLQMAGGDRWTLIALSLATLLPALGTSIANVGLPTIATALGMSFQQAQWIVLAYLLASTALAVSAGRLGDLIGRRRLLLGGIALFTAASALCGLAPTLGLLVAARAAQGLGAAIMMALTLALVGAAVPKARAGAAMGLLGTMSAVGTALGPSLGGLLIAGWGWRAIFLVKVPLGALTFALAHRCLPPDQEPPRRLAQHLDLLGTFLLTLTLVAYALAMTLGRGGFGLIHGGLLLAAAIGVCLFLRNEGHAPSPLIPLAMLREPTLSAGLTMSALVSTVVMATLVVGPFYLARTLHLDPARVGLALSAGPLVAALAGLPAGRLVDRFGTPRMVTLGLSGMVVGSLLLSVLPATSGIWGYISPIAVLTASYALFQAANNTAVMSDREASQRGLTASLLNLSRNLGLITGASAMGAVFATASSTMAPSTTASEAVAHGMRLTFCVATALLMAALVVACVRGRRSRQDRSPGL